MTVSFDVALLAPVPLQHLQSGKLVCAEQGKVAFGSKAWELFRRLDQLRARCKVRTFIYASHSDTIGTPRVSWQAHYIGHIEAQGGRHPQGTKYRPSTTERYPEDNDGYWAIFWEVEGLQEICENAQRTPLSQLTGLDNGKPFKKQFIPQGPLLITYPWLDNQ
jgi:hypothetical protein